MAETFKCSGDCIKCSPSQRIYCASQRSLEIIGNQRVILAQLNELRELISNNGAVEPITDETSTESDAGADNRVSGNKV